MNIVLNALEFCAAVISFFDSDFLIFFNQSCCLSNIIEEEPSLVSRLEEGSLMQSVIQWELLSSNE